VVAASVLIALALVALVAAEVAEWPLDKLAVPMVFAFALGGGFAWGLAVKK